VRTKEATAKLYKDVEDAWAASEAIRVGLTPKPTTCRNCGKPESAVKGYWCLDCVVKLLDGKSDVEG
jgi:hypothetical protein